MVLTASEAELLKGNANLIELLPGSDDSTLCEGSSQQHLQEIETFRSCDFDLSPFDVSYRSRLLLCCYFPMDQSNCMCCIVLFQLI